MKALLLRVGIDKGSGGCLAPIFEDGSFEYIPIPERCATSENITYAHLSGRNYISLADFVPTKLHNSIPHIDPEFQTFTYGDPTPNKRRQLARLVPGDLLVFYAGLEPKNGIDMPRLFIIGYFTVKHVYDFDEIPKSKHGSIFRKVRNNAHAKRTYVDEGLVIVDGNSQNSKLLSNALPLGDVENYVLHDLMPIIGYEGSVLRAIGHWVDDEEHLQKMKKWLDRGVPVLVEEDTHLFSYVLASDTGFAPNVIDGYCTLACCKPRIRSAARDGDWVMGTPPKSLGKNKLGYIMRINDCLSFDEYFNDTRFKNKKPSVNPNADNIYYKKDGGFVQVKNKHHKEKQLNHDTQADRVLISSLFWYFGDKAPKIPCKFIPSLIKTGPGHKRIKDTEAAREFVSWVSSNYRPGIHGNPRDGYDSNSSRGEPSC